MSILFSFIIFFNSCSSDRKKQAAAQQAAGPRPPTRADAYIVKAQTLLDQIELTGTIVANQSTEIHPEVPGMITAIYFNEGANVSKGALLAKLNDADLRAQLNKLSVQLRIAQQNENRSAQLLKIQGISQQDYDMSLLQVNNIRADMAIINTQIAKTSVRAPYSGKLGLRLVSPGAYVSPTTPLTTIIQMSDLKIDFTVPEKYSNKMKIGQFINFTVAGNERNFTAKVAATDANVALNSRSLQVRATVQGDKAGLTPGNFAKVKLSFEPDHNAILVPSQAIIPQARGKKIYVYNNGIAKFIDVETGTRDSAYVHVTEGLKAGDTILVTSLLTLKPDAPVTIRNIVNSDNKTSANKEGEPQKTL
jgi:membrane fusion protein, multidrug efflux system